MIGLPDIDRGRYLKVGVKLGRWWTGVLEPPHTA